MVNKKPTGVDAVKRLSKKLRPYEAERELFNIVSNATDHIKERRMPTSGELSDYGLSVDLIPHLLRYGRSDDERSLPLQAAECLSMIAAFHETGLSFERSGLLGKKIYGLRKGYLKTWAADPELLDWCPHGERRAVQLIVLGLAHCAPLDIGHATACLARYLFPVELSDLPPAGAVNEIVRWAEVNVPLPRGRRDAVEKQAKVIWNSLLVPEPPTAELVDLVKSIFPLEDIRGRWTPNRAVKVRRGCLRLLCLALAQAKSWSDPRVEIPSSWFAARQDPDDPRSILGVCTTNYHRCMLEPLEEAGVLVKISDGDKLRHNCAVYRLSLDPGEEVLTLEHAESMLAT